MIGAVAVGLWAGMTAVLLKLFVHFLQQQLTRLGSDFHWIYFFSPAVGILLTWLFVKWALGGQLARGTSHVLLAIARKSSVIPSKETYSHFVTSAFTVGLGGSAGLESPIVQTGSAIGSTFASLFPVGFRDRTLLLACGAAAGIATAFNAPIAGVLFALEVLLVDVNISAFVPLLMAGATGALCSRIILHEGILFSFREIAAFNYRNIPYYVLLGLLCGLVSVFYIKTLLRGDNAMKRLFPGSITRFFAGSLLLGALIALFPALFGEGYASISSLAFNQPSQIFQQSPFNGWAGQNAWVLGALILALSLIKAFAVTLTLTAGGNGGNFAPSLMVGACLGFAYAFLINLTGTTSLPTSNFCLVAMAGILTGVFHAPLTGVFLIAEITGGYDLIIPLMIVSALSTAVSKYFGTYSLDEARLKEDKQLFQLNKDTHVLAELSISSCIEKDFVPVPLHGTMRDMIAAVAKSNRNIFPVVDEQYALAGIISLENIRDKMFDSTQYDTTHIESLMQQPVAVASPDDEMSKVMEQFDKTGVWNIPVLDKGQYIGFISKSRVLSVYREHLNIHR